MHRLQVEKAALLKRLSEINLLPSNNNETLSVNGSGFPSEITSDLSINQQFDELIAFAETEIQRAKEQQVHEGEQKETRKENVQVRKEAERQPGI